MSITILTTLVSACVTQDDMVGVVVENNHSDFDDDGYLSISSQEFYKITGSRDLPAGYFGFDDCVDDNQNIHPDAAEDYINETDDNCDGVVDDQDGDGFTITAGGDCNDEEAAINPSGTETCDEVDNDCDGSIDEGVTTTWYADSDSDGHYSDSNTREACEAADEYTSDESPTRYTEDCDDDNAATYPDADEIVDGEDNDCDGKIDEDLSTTISGRSNQLAGSYVSYLGDINDDGYDDFGVGAPGYTSDSLDDRGAIALFYGPITTDELSITEADATLIGETEDDNLGAYGFDTIGNYFQESSNAILMGVPLKDAGVGAIYVGVGNFSGHIELEDYTETTDYVIAIQEPSASEAVADGNFGYSVTGLGPVCGDDELDDFIIGAPGYETYSIEPGIGAAYLVCSDSTAKLITYDFGTGRGYHLGVASVAGDFNGDGDSDLAISASHASGLHHGAVYVIDSAQIKDGGNEFMYINDMYEAVISGAADYDFIGNQLASGDADGDGRDDLLIGAEYVSESDGAAYLVLGQSDLSGINSSVTASASVFLGVENQLELVGSDVAITDVDNEGDADVIIGANNASGQGAVYLFTDLDYGSISLSEAQNIFSNGELDSQFGVSLDVRGDYNADGFKDLLVGANMDDSGGTDAGLAELFFGGDF